MVFRSEYPDVPVVNQPIHDVVLAGAARFGDAPALVDGVTGESLSYTQLATAVGRVAAGLAEAGVAKGDVVALHSPNSIAYPIALYAAGRAGAVVTTVSSLATAEELAGQLRDSGASWIITVSALLPVSLAATDGGKGVREIILLDQDGPADYRTLADLRACTAAEPQVAIDPGTDLAVLPYSSGTTGLPKGVMLTHRSIATNLAQLDAVEPGVPGERVIAVLPFFHIYGLVILLHRPLQIGATVVVLPRFDLAQFLRTIQDHRIEGLIVAPPIVLALAKHPLVDEYDLSSIRYVRSAAAPLDADLAAACAARLGLATVQQGYGMTELSPATHIVPLADPAPAPGSVGKLVAATELRVRSLDGGGEDLGVGEHGEIVIRGPQVMKGYLGRPADTDTMIDPDGWLHTGDVGYVDERGYLFIVDRVKELIKYKGYQVAPAELEALLLTHPQIADAAVIGVTGEDGTERPKAFVVRAPGSALTESEVIDFVAARVAPYKKVRAVGFLDAVPKSASGKILRRELRGR
ncbi:AMP-binding protein [Kitasatospora kifunensis]|uniref:Acyl-CoA synthetase (AMP-forming)/AMP-acid ligase II n=1 Tax=Kitasatospora kifunensis TaxID=58351 RepID=A0A7W7R7V7_KITKI|nr:AMP-binding protein [Kitasatospora kifunensis]MBB4927040.1 acyl-CoA synthetase (AMP-forming)/AMP-acid ligase II [Kitasatospora kifunensis]